MKYIPTNDLLYIVIVILISFTLFVVIRPILKALKKWRDSRILIFFLLFFLSAKYWNSLSTALNNFYNKINAPTEQEITKTIFPNIFTWLLQLAGVILIGILIILLLRWLSSSTGVLVQNFVVDENLQKEEGFNPNSIADLLVAELHQIKHIHALIEDGKESFVQPDNSLLALCREPVDIYLASVKGEQLEQALQNVGSISPASEITVPIGPLLLAMRQLWPQGSLQIISGSIYQSGSNLCIAARLQKSNRHSEVHAYQIPQSFQESQPLTELVQDLAYCITFDLMGKSPTTTCWQSFKFFTEALHCVIRYKRNHALWELDRAYDFCLQAYGLDKNYERVGGLMGVIAFFYLNEARNWQSYSCFKPREILDRAIKISPDHPLVVQKSQVVSI